jgi:hypothetical protein
MSNIIKCDSCGKLMYSDSRSDKGDYHEIWIDHSNGYHLCRDCFDKKFMRDIFHLYWSKEYGDYVERENMAL